MEVDTLIAALSGVVTTTLSVGLTYIFTRKKYKAEVKKDDIDNMKSSLDFFNDLNDSTSNIIRDLSTKYETLLQENTRLLNEVQELKLQIAHLTSMLQLEKGIVIDTNIENTNK